MLTDSELASIRDTHDQALPDTCTITRAAGPGTFDESTGQYASVPAPTAVYSGACRVGMAAVSGSRGLDFGEEPVTIRMYVVTLPASEDDVQVDDIVTITDSADTQLEGKVLRVADVRAWSFGITRRLVCQENAG